MSKSFVEAGVTVLVGIVGVAVVALLVSRSSNTPAVLTTSASGFSNALCAALSPLGVCGGRDLIPNVDSSITFPTGGTTFPGSRPGNIF